ncbi:winged helix-turn-helix domain-containing protein [Streptomyces erythrogriseus]
MARWPRSRSVVGTTVGRHGDELLLESDRASEGSKADPSDWRFHLTYTIQGVRKLLVRNGWSCQVTVRRALERDDEAVAGWVKEVWPCTWVSSSP